MELKNEESKFKFIKQINSYPIINFYHDDIKKKTFLFLGFRDGSVYIYDLKAEKIIEKFTTIADITSIDFIFTKPNIVLNEFGRYFIYTEKNDLITIININDDTIKGHIQLENFELITDLCVWNSDSEYEIYIVISTFNNSIKVFRFKDLKQVFSIKLEKDSIPYNLVKILDNNKATKTIKKGLIVCQSNGIEGDSKIMLYC